MPAFLSLFRGINVGGHQKVRMDELKALHDALGLRDVVTYIQSGNVLFTGDNLDTIQLSQQIAAGFAQRFGFTVTVVVRTAGEFRAMMANNPFLEQPDKESKWVLVLFLATRPASTALVELQQAYAGPEEYHLVGQELFVFYPDGIGRSKFTLPLIEKKLKTIGTGRNWNTILQLQKLLLDAGAF
jgi:uncharacterized protein (DUF1697 family)